MFKKIEAALF